jgi:hypothetical protein
VGAKSYRVSALVVFRLIGGDEEGEQRKDEDGSEHGRKI